MTYDAVFLSPHLDDAVLSCGGTIHRQAAAGRRVAVVTVFAGDLEDDPSNRLLQEVYNRMQLRPGEAMATRRREDEAACRRLGAEAVHWPGVEALGRHPDLPNLKALFAEPPESDELGSANLGGRLEELSEVPEIYAPFGFGGHLDHRLVRRAAEQIFGDRLRFYEDFPYVLESEDSSADPAASGFEPTVLSLDETDVAARIDAIRCYKSQIGSLFGPAWKRVLPGRGVGRRVRSYIERVGGERFWSAG